MAALILGVVGLLPDINIYLQLAGAMLAGALAAEGADRVRAQVRSRQLGRKPHTRPLPQEFPPRVYQFGRLIAIYPKTNSLLESLAILCMGLAFAFLAVCLADWLGQGALHFKLILAALGAPVIALCFIYRAARSLIERRIVLVFAKGLVHMHGRRTDVYPWNRIAGVSYTEIGDAIDEQAVEIRLTHGEAPLRFTVAHFQNLDKFWQRIQYEYSRRTLPTGASDID